MSSESPVYTIPVKNTVSFDDVPKANIDCYRWGDGYEPKAFAQLLYVKDEGFALHMEAAETEPKAVYTVYNQEVYKDSCLEFFVNFCPERPYYMNFEMNANGAFLAALRTDRKSKTPIHELLSDLPAIRAEKERNRWYTDVFFTLEQLEKLFGSVNCQAGSRYKGNFYKCGDETPRPHFGMWSPIQSEKADFHRPECFGTLILGEV